MNDIHVTKSVLPAFEEYEREIREIWGSHWLTNGGIKHKQLEEKLLVYLKAKNITLFTNGHLALEAALEVLQIEGEVITTPFTFVSTTHAIARKGLTPVFCDIKEDDYTIDVDQIEACITDKTSAILAVHVYGRVCNMKRIQEIATKHNLKVIYDAAHAFGVEVEGKGIGAFGDLSMFSFHATKVFHTIEGGALTFNNNQLRQGLDLIKNFGISGLETIETIGGNAKMNEFQAAMGLCNLRHVDEAIYRREHVVSRYRECLGDIKGIRLLERQKDIKENYAYFPVLFEGHRFDRDEVFDKLKINHIYPRKYFYPLTNTIEPYKKTSGKTPVAQYIAEHVLTLPLYPDLELKDVERICGLITR